MYPLPETVLPLQELVEHWLKFQPERITYNELATRFLANFWQGELLLREYLNDQTI
jgi:hypothetical protein